MDSFRMSSMQFTVIFGMSALIFNCLGIFAYSTETRITFLFGENQTDLNDFAEFAHVFCFEPMCPLMVGRQIDMNTIPTFALT